MALQLVDQVWTIAIIRKAAFASSSHMVQSEIPTFFRNLEKNWGISTLLDNVTNVGILTCSEIQDGLRIFASI